ncbi:CGNR zinc finger domain-containing protein [Streptomyces griseorubiginosus]|uniref:CGNR zinc finger domain-containing protein n=1 Tax=Streptomyces griseorubiginosus TaxID=67304 RepID=UPI002E806D27|nr:CGNR zinc finger domain-containing protein [Streptomyces griseorubiginosus]WUB42693.1 CGNR zinc finger domain-containing protein [Streptomyces griseorubiginosus]WUB51212.1 CGNR zinc finger domain-containing protein [Streptomyces griseorubiginosus]
MAWSASTRYEVDPAPLGLALVHDLLNTISAGRPRAADLLDDLADAQAWVDQALDGWAQEAAQAPAQVRLTEHDLEELRGLRAELRGLLTSLDGEDSRGDVTGAAPAVHVAAAALRMDREGRVVLEPRGQGWRYVAALVLLEVFQAQRADTWRRLKICRNARCTTAFFDRSRNNSGVWHSTRTCGNPENLRAHRARQRVRSAES